MNTSFVLTILAPDQRGLVEALSRVIADHDGNWVASRMTAMAGQFAGLVWISVPDEQANALRVALERLAGDELRIVVQAADPAAPQPARVMRLELVGHDRPGIVRDLTRELSRRHINVEELTSESYSAPMTGELLFRACIELGVPADADVNALHRALESLAEQLHLDLSCGEPQRASS